MNSKGLALGEALVKDPAPDPRSCRFSRSASVSWEARCCSNELGRPLVKNSRSMAALSTPLAEASLPANSSTPSDFVGPGSTEFTVTPVPAVVSAIPRAGRAVVDRLFGNLQRPFARNGHHAAPVFPPHGADVMPAHADPAEHVDFEEAAPIVVRNFLKRLGLKDSEIVHQDIDRGESLDHGARAKPGRLAGAAPVGFIA